MEQRKVIIPKGPVLVILVGPAGGGKSTFAERNFEKREIVSSDETRIWLTGDIQRQDKNTEVFNFMRDSVQARLGAGQRVVIDATNTQDAPRKFFADLGFMMDVPTFYVVVDRPLIGKLQTGGWRLNVRKGKKNLVEADHDTFEANEQKILAGDYNKWVTVIDTRDPAINVVAAKELPRDPDAAMAQLMEHYTKVRVIADVHGNLEGLLAALDDIDEQTYVLFLGDITDYGVDSWKVVRIIYRMIGQGSAIMVRGNHDRKMYNYITQTMRGEEFSGMITHGMDVSTNQLKAMEPTRAKLAQLEYLAIVEQSPDWIELGEWLFVHAAVDHRMFGDPIFRSLKNSRKESYALYGESDGHSVDAEGKPVRLYNWIEEMPERKNAVLGHQILSTEAPVEKRSPSGGRLIFLDTGSSKGGFLSYLDFELGYTRKHGRTLTPSEEYGRA